MTDLKEKAKNCFNCLQWLQYCHAECCKGFTVKLPKGYKFPKITKFMSIPVILNDSDIHYYHLHGCKYNKGQLLLKIDKYEIIDNVLYVKNRCMALSKDNRCLFHGKPNQPKICHTPSLENHTNLEGAIVTPNCLYGLRD